MAKKEIRESESFCAGCGRRLLLNAKFCHGCGKAVPLSPHLGCVPSQAGKVNAYRTTAVAVLTVAIVIGMLHSIHYPSTHVQPSHAPGTSLRGPGIPSQEGGRNESFVPDEKTPVPYQPPVHDPATEVQVPQSPERDLRATTSAQANATSNSTDAIVPSTDSVLRSVSLDITHIAAYKSLYDGSGWGRDENDQPYATIDIQFTVRNVSTATARNVSLTLNVDGEVTNLGTVQSLPPYGSYQFNQRISLRPRYFYTFDGGRRVQLFEEVSAHVQLTAKTADGTWTEDFTASAPRDLPYPFTVTPNDPVVKSLVDNILGKKARWDIRPNWVVLYNWVNDKVYYNYEKLSNWPYTFWTQLPRETIQWKKGVCIDTAVLLASMLRAAGYGPDEVYVVVGTIPVNELLTGEEAWHAWVILKDWGFGDFEHWQLLETTFDDTPGFIGVINGIFSQLVDAISQALAGRSIFYNEVYIFNDAKNIRLSNPNHDRSANASARLTEAIKMANGSKQTLYSRMGLQTSRAFSSNAQNRDLRNRLQAIVDSLRVPGIPRTQLWANKDKLLDYYVDCKVGKDPLKNGCPNPVNALIFVRAQSKEDSKKEISAMFKELGYFDSEFRSGIRFFDKMYPTGEEMEFFREVSVPGEPLDSPIFMTVVPYGEWMEKSVTLQFHARCMYVCETELGHLWAVCGHVEYSDLEPLRHLFGKKITQRQADASESVTWPYVKWESFEEDLRHRLSNISSARNKMLCVDINYGNSGCYEGKGEYYFNDGVLPVIVIKN